MPFMCTARSSVEQGFEDGLVMTLDRRIEEHLTPSVHRIVGTLIDETAPAPDLDHRAGSDPAHAPEDVDDLEDEASAASFNTVMAAELARFEGGQRIKGMTDDHQLEALARLHATALAELEARHAQGWVERTPLSAREAVVTDVAVATGLSQADLSVRLELATATAARTGFLREQIRSGATSLHRACELVAHTRHLDDDTADDVARTTLAPTRDGAGLTGSLFRQRLRRALLKADTDHAARRRAARARNRAWAEIYDDGTGRLSVLNDADKIAAAYDRADAAARAARAAGDPRSLDQLRADYLTGTAITGWPTADTGTATGAGTGTGTDLGTSSNTVTGTGASTRSDDSGRGSETASAGREAHGEASETSSETRSTASETDGADAATRGTPRSTTGTMPGSGGVAPGAGATGIDPSIDAGCAAPDARRGTGSGGPGQSSGFAGMRPSPAGKAIIVIPFEAALGLDDQPCELSGHGHLSAAQAREIITAPGSIWQTLLADPTTGRAIAVSPSYRPTREMIEHVRAVDGTCRGPGCAVPARNCDLDHDTAWPNGPTHPDNLTAKHRQHHRLKTAGWWNATRDGDTLTWRTAADRTYTTRPKDWLDGRHPDDPSPTPPRINAEESPGEERGEKPRENQGHNPGSSAGQKPGPGPTAARVPDLDPDGTVPAKPAPDPPPF
jgi:hypothetical protein